MCFLGFIRYNKTFIACRFRKYENLFTHEYPIPLGKYLSKNGNSGRKTHEAFEGVEYDIYFTEYDFCPV
jgi:hypothetical protein